MAWFKMDDAFHSSKPVLRIPRKYRLAAVGLWALAGAWCAQEESDGFFPDWVLEEMCGTPAMAAHLVKSGLWIKAKRTCDGSLIDVTERSQASSSDSDESGWLFKNWAKYQFTREQLEEKREKDRIRQENYRLSQRDKKVTKSGLTDGQQHESTTPDPTRPDPSLKERVNAPPTGQSGTTLPSDFRVTAEMTAWAISNCPNIDALRSTTKFKEHYRSVAGRQQFKTDWFAAWRLWLLNDQDRAKPPTTPSTGTSAWDRKGPHGYEGEICSD